MDIVSIILSIKEWLEENVCTEIELKVPPESGLPDDDSYEYTLAHPAVFPLFVPPADKLPEGVTSNVPCICIQLMKGEDSSTNREVSIALGFAVWNPGEHTEDWFNAAPEFKGSMNGWIDVWNMVDITARKLQSTPYLAPNIEVVKGTMDYGPYRQPKENPDDEWQDSFYPFWYAYLRFKVRVTILRNDPELDKYL